MAEKDGATKWDKAQERDAKCDDQNGKAEKLKEQLEGVVYVARREDPRSPGLQRKVTECSWVIGGSSHYATNRKGQLEGVQLGSKS